jgi:hypothetical protein
MELIGRCVKLSSSSDAPDLFGIPDELVNLEGNTEASNLDSTVFRDPNEVPTIP